MASEPLGVRRPSFVERPQEQAVAVLTALRALYRDYLEQQGLDSPREKSVDVEGHAAEPSAEERRFE